MLRLLICLLMLPVICSSLLAQETKVLWSQDFEGQLCGESARGWGRAWGDPGDDLLLISNLRVLSGNTALMLDRMSGKTALMWGMGTTFPDVTEGWAVLSFAFLVQGKADDARFSFTIRDKNSVNFVHIGGENRGGRQLNLLSGDWQKAVPLGEYAEDRWQRARFWLPTRGGAQDKAYCQLEQLDDDGKWRALGPPQSVPAAPPKDGYGLLQINTGPDKRNFMLFLDDVRLEQSDAAPIP